MASLLSCLTIKFVCSSSLSAYLLANVLISSWMDDTGITMDNFCRTGMLRQ